MAQQFPYKYIRHLGSGQFGKVSLVEDKATGQQWAMKEIQKSVIAGDPTAEKNLINEIQLMEKINSENVVKIKEFLSAPNKYYLILEYCADGDLEQYHKQKGNLDQEKVIEILQQIFCGLQALHEVKVVHKDLKQANVFYHNGVFKLGDFGFARQYTNEDLILASTVQGSPAFMAPELLAHSNYYTSKVDMWSIGVMAFFLLFNAYPFDFTDASYKTDLFKFKVGQMPNCDFTNAIKELEQYLDGKIQQKKLHSYWKQFFLGIFTPSVFDRITWQQLYNLPLFKDFDAYAANPTAILASQQFKQDQQRFQKQMKQSVVFYQNLDEKEQIKLIEETYKDEIQKWSYLQKTIIAMKSMQMDFPPAFSNGAIYTITLFLYLKLQEICNGIQNRSNIFEIQNDKSQFLKLFQNSSNYHNIIDMATQKFQEYKQLKEEIGTLTKGAFSESQWNQVNQVTACSQFQKSYTQQLELYKNRLIGQIQQQQDNYTLKAKLFELAFDARMCSKLVTSKSEQQVYTLKKDFLKVDQNSKIKILQMK